MSIEDTDADDAVVIASRCRSPVTEGCVMFVLLYILWHHGIVQEIFDS